MKNVLVQSIKKGIKISFGLAFWFVFGMIILVAGVTKGIGLAIALSILFGIGYWIIVKVTRYSIRKGKQNARKDKGIAGIN